MEWKCLRESCIVLQHTPSTCLHWKQSQSITEFFEFLRIQWFCKYIHNLIGHRNIVQFDCTILDFLTHPMMTDLNVFGACMKMGLSVRAIVDWLSINRKIRTDMGIHRDVPEKEKWLPSWHESLPYTWLQYLIR